MGNVAIFGGSTFAGPRQFIDQAMFNENGREVVRSSKTWRLQRYPVVPAPSVLPVNFSGVGAAGAYLEPGLWVLSDQLGGAMVFEAPAIPQVQIILLRWDSHVDTDKLWAYDLADGDATAASVGGGPLPIVSRSRPKQQGACRLIEVPEGIHAVLKYKTTVTNNVWLLSFGQDGVDQITMTATPVPTTTVLASGPADIVVKDGDTPVIVESLNPETGVVTLAEIPTRVPTASYWALVGEVFG